MVKIKEMNMFGSKKEAVVTAAVAAFFVLLALVLTFEPLVSVVLKTRTMPPGTEKYVFFPLNQQSNGNPSDIVADIISDNGPSEKALSFLEKNKETLFAYPLNAVFTQSSSIVLETPREPEQVFSDLRRLFAKQTPFEIKTILPDKTAMIEIVIDPKMIKVEENPSDKPDYWLFTQTDPQVSVEKNGLNTLISINYPHLVDARGFKSPTNCQNTSDNSKILSLSPKRSGLTTALIRGFSAYFKNYSCFQSFSTVGF